MIIYEGWVHAPLKDRKELEDLGISLGDYYEGKFLSCELSEETLLKLDKYWGKWYWGFEIRQEDR